MKKSIGHNSEYKILLVFKDVEDKLMTESVWGEKVEDNYRILNTPFFAPNIAYKDIVSVQDDDGTLYYDDLIEESGHSTIQMTIFDVNNQKQIGQDLVNLGCDWEGSHLKGYISIDIPKTISYDTIKKYLENGAEKKLWDYKEACLSSIHKSSLSD